jgi:hypothetical protein
LSEFLIFYLEKEHRIRSGAWIISNGAPRKFSYKTNFAEEVVKRFGIQD